MRCLWFMGMALQEFRYFAVGLCNLNLEDEEPQRSGTTTGFPSTMAMILEWVDVRNVVRLPD